MDGLFSVARQPLEEGPAGWVSKRLENVHRYDLHSRNHNQMVMVCQEPNGTRDEAAVSKKYGW